jgi:hypothetical protein
MLLVGSKPSASTPDLRMERYSRGQRGGGIELYPSSPGYVREPEQYAWSSASLYLNGFLSRENGLSYETVTQSLVPYS